ncbi:MAG: hypothetical protein ABIE14_01490 [Patescibacteria group bacterium]
MKFSCCKLPTEGLGQLILAAWLIFSVVFVANSVWQAYTLNQAEVQQVATAAYQQSQSDVIDQLLQQAETCEAFPIYSGETQIELKKVGCE